MSVAAWRFVLVMVGATLGACHREGIVISPSTNTGPHEAALPLSQIDLGVSLLAELENARCAIAMDDPIAAANDIAVARSFAVRLPDRPSRVVRTEPMGGHRRLTSAPGAASAQGPLTDFQALVGIDSAQSQLPDHWEAADGFLRSLLNGVPIGQMPTILPLVRAAASLDLARDAASEGRTTGLKTQLQCARAALNAYVTGPHQNEARALAVTIDQIMSDPAALQTMSGFTVSAWLSRVTGWAGSESWNPSPPDIPPGQAR